MQAYAGAEMATAAELRPSIFVLRRRAAQQGFAERIGFDEMLSQLADLVAARVIDKLARQADAADDDWLDTRAASEPGHPPRQRSSLGRERAIPAEQAGAGRKLSSADPISTRAAPTSASIIDILSRRDGQSSSTPGACGWSAGPPTFDGRPGDLLQGRRRSAAVANGRWRDPRRAQAARRRGRAQGWGDDRSKAEAALRRSRRCVAHGSGARPARHNAGEVSSIVDGHLRPGSMRDVSMPSPPTICRAWSASCARSARARRRSKSRLQSSEGSTDSLRADRGGTDKPDNADAVVRASEDVAG